MKRLCLALIVCLPVSMASASAQLRTAATDGDTERVRALLEQGADLPTLQALLGHADLKATSIYLHLSERHLKAAGTPIDQVEFSSPDKVRRSKKLHKKK